MMAMAVVFGAGSLVLFALIPVGSRTLVPLRLGTGEALAWDALLSFLFFLQHSGMIREGFEQWLKGIVPANYRRAVYSVASGVALGGVVVLWQTTGVQLWELEGPVLWVARGARVGAMVVFVWGAVALQGVDLLGVGAIRGKGQAGSEFTVRGPYRWVRHPWYFAVLLLIWSGTVTTTDRLLFNVLWTAWIVVGTYLEERDLVRAIGAEYEEYQRRVPMLIPTGRTLGRR